MYINILEGIMPAIRKSADLRNNYGKTLTENEVLKNMECALGN